MEHVCALITNIIHCIDSVTTTLKPNLTPQPNSTRHTLRTQSPRLNDEEAPEESFFNDNNDEK